MDYSLDIKSKDISYDVRGDINGNLRIIDFETAVTIDAKVYTESRKEIVTDTYSTENVFHVKNENILLTQTLGNHDIDETLKQVIDIKGTELSKLCSVRVDPVITDKRILEEKVIVEGIAELDIIYIGSDRSLNVLNSEIPFKSYVDIEENCDIDVEVKSTVKDVSYSKLNGSEIEVEVSLSNQIEINTIKSINIVSEAKETEKLIDKKSRASITIYMVQKNDTVWDIAKRYSTTVCDIISTNDIEEGNLNVGETIIIEKHLDTTLQAYA